jgi:predicted NAD/FAD-dependent oxidoreductase
VLADAGSVDEGVLLLVGRPGFERVHPPGDERGATTSLLRGAATLLPGLSERIVASRLHRLPAGVPGFDVGHYRAASRFLGERAASAPARRVILCGDYLCDPHLEGAAASGFQAAKATLRILGGG